MSELEKILSRYRHRIPLDGAEIQLLIFALRDYKNSELEKERKALLEKLKIALHKRTFLPK